MSLSSTTTRASVCASAWRTKFAPMKPAPPVTTIVSTSALPEMRPEHRSEALPVVGLAAADHLAGLVAPVDAQQLAGGVLSAGACL